MANYNSAYKIMEGNEGGWVDDDADSGKETYAGVSRKWFPTWPGWKIVDANKPLKTGQIINDAELQSLVKQFYKKEFWDKIKGDFIVSQSVALNIFDFFVNAGTAAIKIVQKIIGATPDGQFGDKTLQAIHSMPSADLIAKIKKERKDYYNRIVAANPDQKKFLKGWLNRVDTLA